MRLLIPIDESKGIESGLSSHFGHCPFFAIYETETKKVEIVRNELDHSDPSLTPVDQIMKFKPDIVFSLGMGQRAINLFKQTNVMLKTGNLKTVKEVIDNIDNLNDLESACLH